VFPQKKNLYRSKEAEGRKQVYSIKGGNLIAPILLKGEAGEREKGTETYPLLRPCVFLKGKEKMSIGEKLPPKISGGRERPNSSLHMF